MTFRSLVPHEIVDLVTQAHLTGIEWSGDMHVPLGNMRRAKEVRQMTVDAGLEVAAYGSYYRVGHPGTGPFEQVVETALQLGAPLIRVWAGRQGTAVADQAYVEQVIEDSAEIAKLAAQENIVVAYEYHANTLTDSDRGVLDLLTTVNYPNLRSYWQKRESTSVEQNVTGLTAVLPWLVHIHVANRDNTTGSYLPLADAEQEWIQYLQRLSTTGRDHYALIEFVRGNNPDAFLNDAAALRGWLKQI